MKFGGTSVGDARSIRQVVQIVRQQRHRAPVVVVSAHAGVTDELLALAGRAAAGDADTAAIAERHRAILRDLGLPTNLLDTLLGELADLARGLRLVGAVSPKALDRLASFGERCSARTVAAAMQHDGLPATAVDAHAAGLRTDSSFGRARPLPDDGRIREYLTRVVGIPVVTGFLGGDEHGNLTTLGRNGSDYSAALFGVAVDAEEIQVWKDVDGVRTADPRVVPTALPIRAMSYAEACELTAFGSKVLHPGAMLPAMQRGIPLSVRSTLEPEAPGTRIEAGVTRAPVRAIAHRARVAKITVTSPRFGETHTLPAQVFAELAELSAEIGPIAVSTGCVVLAIGDAHVDAAATALARHGEVVVVRDCAVVGVVGDPAAMRFRVVAEVTGTLADAGIALSCAGQGADDGTFAFVVRAAELLTAVRALHARFFGNAP